MKRMRRQGFAPLAALALAAVLVLSACGSSGSGNKSGSGDTNPTSPNSQSVGGNSAPLFGSLPANIQKAGVIRIGSAINYPPFENYAPDGKTLVGFEVDLANALQKQLGVKFQWNNASFDSLFASLKSDRYDIVYGATNDTAEREQSFNFVDYLQASQGFVVLKGNPQHITTTIDLCGKSVAAVTGGVQPEWLRGAGTDACKKAGKAAINTLTFADASGEQLAVRGGKAAALLENYPTAVTFAQESNGVLELVPNVQVLKTYFGMVIPKNSSKLQGALQKGWQTIMDNGEYAKVLAKWNLSGVALKTAYINGATTHPIAN
jgi:polar amino acid transport system substrate-binding protein